MHSVTACAIAVLLAPEQARESERVDQYLRLAQATVENPITHDELAAAVLSEEGILTIAQLFEESIAASVDVGGQIVTPELGGEAMLSEGRLTFVAYPDPVHDVIRSLLELQEDPRAMLEFLEGSPPGKHVLTTTGGLHALLYQLNRSPGPLSTEQRGLRNQVLFSAAEIHFKVWNVDTDTQREGIEKGDWRGRYVGFWHIHPARIGRSGLLPGIEPSLVDTTNAVEQGQFVTIVFQPDGFDFYDLAPLGDIKETRLSLAKIVRHRSKEWRERFESLVTGRSNR